MFAALKVYKHRKSMILCIDIRTEVCVILQARKATNSTFVPLRNTLFPFWVKRYCGFKVANYG